MSYVYVLIAGLAALCFYLASPHQRLWRRALAQARRLRAAGWLGCAGAGAGAVSAASVPLGFWAGLFAALSALILALVALPYLDACRSARHMG